MDIKKLIEKIKGEQPIEERTVKKLCKLI